MMNKEQKLSEKIFSPLIISVVSGSLSHSEALASIHKKCLDSTHPLRFIQHSIDEKWYMNEYNFLFGSNCH